MKWALLKATAARWLLPAFLALAVAGLTYSHYLVYGLGQDAQRAEMQSELDKARERQAVLADELELERQQRRVVYRDRVRVVEREPDPSGCADIRLPDGMRAALRGDPDGQ